MSRQTYGLAALRGRIIRGMKLDAKTFALTPDHYFAQGFQKSLIVRHFTAGTSASSAYHTWIAPDSKGRPQHVSTAFVVDPDGTVFQFFDPQHWGYALGMVEVDLSWANDKRAVQIEIANVGPLRLSMDGKSLNWWPSNFGVHWCDLTETTKYVKAEFRGEHYFATFPQSQVDAVFELETWIGKEFGIPLVNPTIDRISVYDPKFFSKWKGIASHQQARRDKVDIGPAWNWTPH